MKQSDEFHHRNSHTTIVLACPHVVCAMLTSKRSPRCPGMCRVLSDPEKRDSPREVFCSPMPITSVASPMLSQHNSLPHHHQGTCKDPNPDSSWQPLWAWHRLHP